MKYSGGLFRGQWRAELERVLRLDMDPGSVMLGINNRDLQSFKVDLQNNQRIMESPAGQEVGTALLSCPGGTAFASG